MSGLFPSTARSMPDVAFRPPSANGVGLRTEHLPCLLPWRREEAELPHEAEHVSFGPLFYNLAVHNSVDVRAGHTRFVPRRRDPLKCSDVLDARGLAIYHEVAFGDEEVRLRRRADIEGRPVAGKQVFERLTAA